MKQNVGPAALIGAVVALIAFLGFMAWKFFQTPTAGPAEDPSKGMAGKSNSGAPPPGSDAAYYQQKYGARQSPQQPGAPR